MHCLTKVMYLNLAEGKVVYLKLAERKVKCSEMQNLSTRVQVLSQRKAFYEETNCKELVKFRMQNIGQNKIQGGRGEKEKILTKREECSDCNWYIVLLER